MADKNVDKVGWGVQLSGTASITPWLTAYYQGVYGKGVASYIQDLCDGRMDLLPSASNLSVLNTVKTWGAYGALQFNICPSVFASASYSHVRNYMDGNIFDFDCYQYRYAQYVGANVFWDINNVLQAGVEYIYGRRGWIDAACVEYIDFTNQSGPIHWAPGDHEGNEIPGQATGADDYYNNYFYDGWANYGMSMGTPFIKSPIYNTDGYLRFTDNRLRGFHAGISGSPTPDIDYRLLVGYRQSLGTPTAPSPHKRQATSAMLEGKYRLPALKGLTFSLQLAFDAGSLTGNRFGAMLGVTYDGLISLGKHQKAIDNE